MDEPEFARRRIGPVKWIGSDSRIGQCRVGRSEAHRIAVDALEEPGTFGTDITNAEHQVASDFTLQFKAERIVNRRCEIRRDLRTREDSRVHGKGLERSERIRHVRAH